MEPQITARHLDLTPKIKDHARKALMHLNKFYENIVAEECILSKQKFMHSAEMRVTVYREIISASAENEDLFAAIDQCADKIKAQLNRYKGRLKEKDPTEVTNLATRTARPETDVDAVDM